MQKVLDKGKKLIGCGWKKKRVIRLLGDKLIR